MQSGATAGLRVAIVHERFTELGGSERVVEQMHAIWPDAPIFAPLLERAALPPGLAGADVRTGPLQRLAKGRHYAHLLPLLPIAVARLDLSDFDLVVTSHHAFANRVRPPRGIPVVSYTHTPARWIWDPVTRVREVGGRAGRIALAAFAATQRRADLAAAARLSGIVANSRHVSQRIARWWHRDAVVVPPPVDTEFHTPDPSIERDDFFLVAGRLVPYKQTELAVAAAVRAGVRVVVVGDGRSRPSVEAAAGPSVELLGRVDDATLRDLYRRCRALVFPGEEDFGIVPVEAQACGTPVIARGLGGVLDSVVHGLTGVMVDPARDPLDALTDALRDFDAAAFDSTTIRAHAEQFGRERFRERFEGAVSNVLDNRKPS